MASTGDQIYTRDTQYKVINQAASKLRNTIMNLVSDPVDL